MPTPVKGFPTACGENLDCLAEILGVKRRKRFLFFRESDRSFRRRLCLILSRMPVGALTWVEVLMGDVE